MLETAIIPVELAPELDQRVDRLDDSLYDLLASEYGLIDSYEEQYLEVIGPTQDETRLLEMPARAQVVRIRGLSTDSAGTPFDCFEQLYPGESVRVRHLRQRRTAAASGSRPPGLERPAPSVS